MSDFYGILGVPRNAGRRDIKQRFLELARERHPDRFQGSAKDRAETEFQAITEAFNVLSDPIRRRQHDLELDRPVGEAQKTDPAQLLRTYLNRGIRSFKQKNFIEAAHYFRLATEVQPQNAQAWHHLALTAVQEDRWLLKAQEAIEQACRLDPRNVVYQRLAGKIFAKSGMVPKAREYYNRALSLDDNDPAVRRALAELERPRQGDAKPAAQTEDPGDRTATGFFRKLW